MANKVRTRKGYVANVNRVLCSGSIVSSLNAVSGLPSSVDLFALLLARHSVRDKYGIHSFNQLVCMSCMDAIEWKIGFFWSALSIEIDRPKNIFLPLVRKGYFERTERPLAYSHILTARLKLFKLSPLGREVLAYFQKEYRKNMLNSKIRRRKIAEQLK